MLFLSMLLGCGECVPDGTADSCMAEVLPPLPEHPSTPPGFDDTVTEVLGVSRAQVDVLFVIDNSDATPPEVMDHLADDWPALFDSLADQRLDYHLGVVNSVSGRNAGRLIGWTGSRERFDDLMFTARPLGQSAGYGRLNAYRAIRPLDEGLNAGFHRVDAQLHVIFVSGQDDLSVDPDPLEFTSWLRLSPPRGGVAHAVVPPDSPQYERYVEATGGQHKVLLEDRLDYANMWGKLRPPRLFLSELPAEPTEVNVTLYAFDHDPFSTRVCAADAVYDDCVLVYEAGSNALDWVGPIVQDVYEATITYARQN